jgi:hypothetical protein
VPDTIRAHTKVPVLCNKHNVIFYQTASSHLLGAGCPRCGKQISSVENSLYIFVKEKEKDIICRYRGWTNSRHEIDLFLPKQKIGIEYNGLAYHHSAEGFPGYKDPSYHKEKSDLAVSAGIRLYHIFEGFFSLNILKGITHAILNHQRIAGSEHYYFKKGVRYGIVQRDLCPLKEDSFFYKHNWTFIEWKPYAFYWKPGSSNGKNTFNLSRVPRRDYRPVYTSGFWVFRES